MLFNEGKAYIWAVRKGQILDWGSLAMHGKRLLRRKLGAIPMTDFWV